VGGGVAKDEKRVGVGAIPRRQDADPHPIREREAQIGDVAVDAHADRLLRELGPDRARRIEPGCAVREFKLRAIGKDHPHDGERG
jgi:hypothetical protein